MTFNVCCLTVKGIYLEFVLKRLFLLFLLFILALPSEARRKKVVKETVQRTQLAPADARRLSYFYQEGIKQKLAGNLSEAHDLFQHCLDIDPEDPDALFEMAYMKFFYGQDSVGTALFRRVVELDNRNPRYIQSLAAAYLAQNQFDEAIPVVERLAELQTRRSDVLYQLVELYKANGKTDEAIRALDRIELLEGRNLQTSMQKYALYIDQDRKNEAFAVLEDLQRESPYDLRIPLIRGKQYLDNDEPDKALECFNAVAQADPQNAELRMAMMDYYAHTKQTDLRQSLRDSLLYAKDTPDDVRTQMVAVLIDDLKGQPRQKEVVMETLDSLIRLSPTPLMYSLRVSYLMHSQASQDSITVAMRELLKVDPSNENALSRMLALYLSQRDMEQVAEICRMGINTHPESLTYYYYLGIALTQMKQNDSALEVLQGGLKQAEGQAQPELVADIYEILGEIYHEQGRIEEAFAAYDSCLVYKDDHAACLNNYAYYLSLQDKRLDEAERMAYRAIKAEPLNKTYLDTYAWVLFMQKNYTMAKFYIDRVISPSTSDSLLLADEDVHADVLEHAGDIYALNGDLETAMRYWSLAQQKGSESAVLTRKLKQKKYIKE